MQASTQFPGKKRTLRAHADSRTKAGSRTRRVVMSSVAQCLATIAQRKLATRNAGDGTSSFLSMVKRCWDVPMSFGKSDLETPRGRQVGQAKSLTYAPHFSSVPFGGNLVSV